MEPLTSHQQHRNIFCRPVAAYLNESQIIKLQQYFGHQHYAEKPPLPPLTTLCEVLSDMLRPLSLIDQTCARSITYNFSRNISSSLLLLLVSLYRGNSGFLNNGASIDISGRVNPTYFKLYHRYSKYHTSIRGNWQDTWPVLDQSGVRKKIKQPRWHKPSVFTNNT
jgi:hypothetical protein